MTTPLDTNAIRAILEQGMLGEQLIADPRFILSLCDALDEARATLANERGEGEGPSVGWHWSNGRQAWIYQPWLRTPKEHGPERVVRRGPLGWELYLDGLRTPDEYESARAAMIAADKTRSPA